MGEGPNLYLLLTIVLFTTNLLYAQLENCDTALSKLELLRSDLPKMNSDEALSKLDSLSKLIPKNCNKAIIESKFIAGRCAYKNGDFILAEEFYNSAKILSDGDINTSKLIASAQSDIYRRDEKYTKALEILEDAYEIRCNTGDLKCYEINISLLTNSSINLQRLDRYDEAIDKYILADSQMKEYEIVDSLIITSINNQMGNIYKREFRDYESSLRYYEKALNHVPVGNKGKYLIGNNIGFIYVSLLKLDSAYIYFNKSINEANSSRYFITAYQGLGALSARKKQYGESIKYYGKALENAKIANKKSSIFSSRIYLAKIHFLSGNFETSRSLLEAAIESKKGKNISDKQQSQIDLYSHLISIAVLDSNLSYKVYQDFLDYDTIAIDNHSNVLNKSISKYEKIILRDSLAKQVLLKENEAEKVKNYRLSTLALILGLLLAGGVAYQFRRLFFGQKQENEELVFKNQELEKLNQTLEKKAAGLSIKPTTQETPKEVQIKSIDKIYNIDVAAIKYLKAEDDGTRVYYDDTSKWTGESLKELKTKFPDDIFVQTFRGIIVNINYVLWINGTSLKLKDNIELKISRTYKQDIKDAIES